MDMKQEIEKMAELMIEHCFNFAGCCSTISCKECLAKALYNANYRNADDLIVKIKQLEEQLDNKCDMCIERERAKTAREILKMLHEAGGCHSTDEWSTGYDAAIDFLFAKIQRKYGLATEEVLEE